jgi:hypothetical protein
MQSRKTHAESRLFVGYSAEKEPNLIPTDETIPKDAVVVPEVPSPLQIIRTAAVEPESWEADSKLVELMGLLLWMGFVSVFILINNFVGPWPGFMNQVHERIWFTLHMLGGMLFGGGVILTTAMEWLVAQNKNASVLSFWFDKVPLLDMAIVLPGLTLSMISGTGLSIVRYGGLALAPVHVQVVFWTLVAFAAWWAVTDLTTQGSALEQVNEWAATNGGTNHNNHHHPQNADDHDQLSSDIPDVVHHRKISNIVSCIFVVLIYAEMVLKPGTLHY